MPDIGHLLNRIRSGHDSAVSVTSGFGMIPQQWRDGPREFVPRADRWFGLTVEVEALGLPTLPDRMTAALRDRLIVNLQNVADRVIEDGQKHLYKPADFPRHRHGEDTGRLKRSLVSKLVEEITDGVFYDFYSDDAAYWVFVEFGRLRPDGTWWPGYHYLTSAITRNYRSIQNAVRISVHETFTLLAAEARVPSGRAMPLPPSSAGLGPVGPGGALLEQG